MLSLRDTIRVRSRSHRRRQVSQARPGAFEMSGCDPNESSQEQRLFEAFKLCQEATAFEALVAIHRDAVFDLARRILGDGNLAEDIAQDTFLTLYRKASTISSELSLRSWLLEVARRNAFERRRAKGRSRLREAHYAMTQPNRLSEVAPGSIDTTELQQALNSLPEE